MKQFQSKWLPAGSVVTHANPYSPQTKGREERLYMQRARRLRDRADREGWTSSELYTAMNSGCRIGRVTLRRDGLHPIPPTLLTIEVRQALLRAMAQRPAAREFLIIDGGAF